MSIQTMQLDQGMFTSLNEQELCAVDGGGFWKSVAVGAVVGAAMFAPTGGMIGTVTFPVVGTVSGYVVAGVIGAIGGAVAGAIKGAYYG